MSARPAPVDDVAVACAAAAPGELDVFEHAAIGMACTDRQGRFQRVNSAFADLVGRTPGALVGAEMRVLTEPDDVAASQAAMRDLVSRRVGSAVCEQRYLRPDGTAIWVEMHLRSLTDGAGTVVGVLAEIVDIDRRKRAQESMESERRRLQAAQRVAGIGSFEQDVATGGIRLSAELRRMLGMPGAEVDEIDTSALLDRIHPDDRAVLGSAIRACIEDGSPVDLKHRMLAPDGTVTWVHARAMAEHSVDGGAVVVGTVQDITALKMAEEALEFQMFHDALTGLANRALFLDRVDHVLHQAERRSDPVAMLFMDVDDFKLVNDSLGHDAGDTLLADVAKRLASVARAADTLARLGGDEFALLLESGPMPDTAEAIARRIESVLAAPFRLDDTTVNVRVSIGVAVGRRDHDTAQDLLRDADLAMYLAKQNGKGRVEMVRPGMQAEALQRLAVITDLQAAVGAGEFELFYQPIVDARDGAPGGAEALARWRHPTRGLLPPSAFIDVAESTGLIVALGDWVLGEACRQTAAWRRDGTVDDDFYVSVNLSPRQLTEAGLVARVATCLCQSGLPPANLVLEITESTLMLDYEAALARLHALKDLGLRLALDDYGTGFSSLNRLGSLPVDIVKIDKSFVDDVTATPEGTALVRSVLDVTHALGLRAVAEGVEEPAQRAALAGMGCEDIQGYLFAPPLPPDDAAQVIRRLAAGRRASPEAPGPRDAAAP